MDITIYLPDETGKWAKEHDLSLSRMLRDAIHVERRRLAALEKVRGEATTYELSAQEPDGYGGFSGFKARLHGTLIAKQNLGGHGSVEVYLGDDQKLYVHDFDGQLHRDVEPAELRDHVDESTYIEAMRALGEEPVIDIGMAEPEVDPEDLRKHGDKAVRLVHDLGPGDSVRWADAVNTAASLAEAEDPGQ
jgi:hypothetical protein